MSRKQSSWLGLSFAMWRAGLEAQQVIALRLAKLARGGAAATTEMNRMVAEKAAAGLEAQSLMAAALLKGDAAGIPSKTLALYRRKMRANRNRLAAGDAPGPPATRRPKSRSK